MKAKAGDRIEIESETVGSAARQGEILEVMEGEVSVRYRIRWVDGHETVIAPSGGTARIIPRPAKKKAKTKASKGR